MITDVGIDLDGVMYDFAWVFHKYAQDRMGKELSEPSTWDFYREWGMTDEQFNEWLEDGVKNLRLFDYLNPLFNTHEGWKLLKDNNIKIHVLTHRSPHSYEQTVQWLVKNNLIPDSLHFGQNKTILKTLAQDECAAIDDMVQFYDSYNKEGVLSFLRTQPWNQERRARRCADLLEFAQAIVAINASKQFLLEHASLSKNRLDKLSSIKFPLSNPDSQYQIINNYTQDPHKNEKRIIKYNYYPKFRYDW